MYNLKVNKNTLLKTMGEVIEIFTVLYHRRKGKQTQRDMV